MKAANPNITGRGHRGPEAAGRSGLPLDLARTRNQRPAGPPTDIARGRLPPPTDATGAPAAPDQQKGFGVVVTKAGATTSPGLESRHPEDRAGSPSYKVTLVTANGGSTKVDASVATICLWNGTQMKADVSELYAVPGHATDICVQIQGCRPVHRGLSENRAVQAGRQLAEAQYVQVGKGTMTMTDASVTYAGGTSNLDRSDDLGHLSGQYATNRYGPVDGPAVRREQSAASDWVTLTTATAAGGGNITMRANPQTGYVEPKSWLAGKWLRPSTRGGQTASNTANCYLVHAPGTYTLPLVYGNAIKDGPRTPRPIPRRPPLRTTS